MHAIFHACDTLHLPAQFVDYAGGFHWIRIDIPDTDLSMVTGWANARDHVDADDCDCPTDCGGSVCYRTRVMRELDWLCEQGDVDPFSLGFRNWQNETVDADYAVSFGVYRRLDEHMSTHFGDAEDYDPMVDGLVCYYAIPFGDDWDATLRDMVRMSIDAATTCVCGTPHPCPHC